MNKITIGFLIIYALVIPAEAKAETAKDVYITFKMFEARCEEGITKYDYVRGLGELKFTLSMFVESMHNSQDSKLANIFNNVLAHYRNALEYFPTNKHVSCTLSRYEAAQGKRCKRYSLGDKSKKEIDRMNDRVLKGCAALLEELSLTYPEVKKTDGDGGAISFFIKYTMDGSECLEQDKSILNYKYVFKIILTHASQELIAVGLMLER